VERTLKIGFRIFGRISIEKWACRHQLQDRRQLLPWYYFRAAKRQVAIQGEESIVRLGMFHELVAADYKGEQVIVANDRYVTRPRRLILARVLFQYLG